MHDWSSRDEIQLLLKLGTKLRIILRILSELTIFATSFRRNDYAQGTEQGRRLSREGLRGRHQGHVQSQKNCGAAYWNGDGVEKDLEECAFWYELAANGGDAQSQFATGWFLMTGTGVPVDEKKGLKWIHTATFQGYQPAIDYCKEHGYKWY